jgi:predicted transcriptional regulator
MDGEKRVEFRKVLFKRTVSHVIVYATSPVMKVIGAFEVSQVEAAPPAELWRKYRQVGGIERDEFFAYFSGRTSGIALHVGVVLPLKNPLRLDQLAPDLVPPQSFVYLKSSCLHGLRRSEVAGQASLARTLQAAPHRRSSSL